MDTDWDEQSEETQTVEPPQFSLRTLMTVVTLVAVFFSFVAWWGLYPVVFILSGALGIFLGLLLCSYIGLGFGFEDLRWDIAKCLIVAFVAILPIYVLSFIQFQMLPVNTFIIFSGLAYWISMKIAWYDLQSPEIFLSGVCLVFTSAFAVYFTYQIFGA